MSEYDRRTGVKKLRVRGLKAVTFAAVLKAIGINLFRAAAFKKRQNGGINPLTPEYWAIFYVIRYLKEQIVLLFSLVVTRWASSEAHGNFGYQMAN